ncbi:MAG: bifunctional adenosylcobinamide kinase/adenosylcobinamide-phosphate guanylyltransferase [Firmicutes bacterium]|nr:bifunctional adenosylcobinamide kinase/adenosylcobinamide-phosphate guanylyltransferase [Bacillota bacterium]
MTSEARRGLILVLGGARSGKSAVAEKLVAESGLPVTYLATARVADDEMRERVIRHQQRRPKDWTTIEAPGDVHEIIDETCQRAYLIDCLTLYLSNCLMDLEKEGLSPATLQEECLKKVDALIEAAGRSPGLVVIVSNEVGQGVVPAYPLGRLFRDLAGWANQRVAAAANEVFFCVAGIPVELKRLQQACASAFLTRDMKEHEESDA